MVNVKWTKRALADADSIAEYIAKDSVYYAKIQIKRFFDKVEILKIYPKIGRIVPERKQPNIRDLILGNYRLIYKVINKNQIHILTIHHSKRLLRNI